MNTRQYLEFLHGDRLGWAIAMYRADAAMKTLGSYRWPADAAVMAAKLADAAETVDVYASVYLFDKARRLSPYAIASDVIYLEVDDPSQAWRGVEPTLTVESSPGRCHHYWRLDREVEPAEMRRLLAAMVSAGEGDPAAKDLARVLRPPGTWSHKRNTSVHVAGGTGEVYSVPEVIGDRVIPAPPKQGDRADGTDLEAWLAAHGIPASPRSDELGIKFSVACPWGDAHSTPGDPYVGKIDGGGLWFWCPHASCASRAWRDYHDHYAGAAPIGSGKTLFVAGRPVGKRERRGILKTEASKSGVR
jgi:hypothetical protein